MVRIYFNTSILIRAVNPREARHGDALRFIETCRSRGHELVVSILLFEERLRKATLEAMDRLFRIYGFVIMEVDVRSYIVRAMEWCWNRGYSAKRVLDVAHLMVAKDLGCRYIAAVDRFIKRHAKEFGLVYVNYYTGAP